MAQLQPRPAWGALPRRRLAVTRRRPRRPGLGPRGRAAHRHVRALRVTAAGARPASPTTTSRPRDVVVVATAAPSGQRGCSGTEIPVPTGAAVGVSVLDLGLEPGCRDRGGLRHRARRPRYASVHCPARSTHRARRAASGSPPTAAVPRAELEAFADALAAGLARRGPAHDAPPPADGIDHRPPHPGARAAWPAGRGPRCPGAPGASVAGDWVGPTGLLLDATLSSAAAAARAARRPVPGPRRPGTVVAAYRRPRCSRLTARACWASPTACSAGSARPRTSSRTPACAGRRRPRGGPQPGGLPGDAHHAPGDRPPALGARAPRGLRRPVAAGAAGGRRRATTPPTWPPRPSSSASRCW